MWYIYFHLPSKNNQIGQQIYFNGFATIKFIDWTMNHLMLIKDEEIDETVADILKTMNPTDKVFYKQMFNVLPSPILPQRLN